MELLRSLWVSRRESGLKKFVSANISMAGNLKRSYYELSRLRYLAQSPWFIPSGAFEKRFLWYKTLGTKA